MFLGAPCHAPVLFRTWQGERNVIVAGEGEAGRANQAPERERGFSQRKEKVSLGK